MTTQISISGARIPSYSMDQTEEEFYQQMTPTSSTPLTKLFRDIIIMPSYEFTPEETKFYASLRVPDQGPLPLPEEVVIGDILPKLTDKEIFDILLSLKKEDSYGGQLETNGLGFGGFLLLRAA